MGFLYLVDAKENSTVMDFRLIAVVFFVFMFTFAWLLVCNIGNLIDEMVRIYFAQDMGYRFVYQCSLIFRTEWSLMKFIPVLGTICHRKIAKLF